MFWSLGLDYIRSLALKTTLVVIIHSSKRVKMKKQLRATDRGYMKNHKLLFVYISVGLLFSILCLSSYAQTDTAQSVRNFLGMKFIYIKPGSFIMGSPANEADRTVDGRFDDEPQHRVNLTKGFYMQNTEVTVGQWREFVKETRYRTEAEKGDGALIFNPGPEKGYKKKAGFYWNNPGHEQTDMHPVTCISWNDMKEFIKWINGKDNATYRLPTEAEWEYACRAGTSTPFYWGDNPEDACKHANVGDKAKIGDPNWAENAIKNDSPYWGTHNCNDGYGLAPASVGKFSPNNFGIYDMIGNVWELVEDTYNREAYSKHKVDNPAYTKEDRIRFLRDGKWIDVPVGSIRRGGSYIDVPKSVRCACRGYAGTPPSSGYQDIGFRLVREQ